MHSRDNLKTDCRRTGRIKLCKQSHTDQLLIYSSINIRQGIQLFGMDRFVASFHVFAVIYNYKYQYNTEKFKILLPHDCFGRHYSCLKFI